MKSKKQKDIGNILLLMVIGIILFGGGYIYNLLFGDSSFLDKTPSVFIFYATMIIGCIISVIGYFVKTKE